MSGARDPAPPGLPVELERILHDLRGPLNALFMHVELLKHACPADGVARQAIGTVERELQRLARMLPAAFSVVALERGADATVDLRAIVEEAARAMAPASVTIAGDRWPRVRGDRDLLVLAVSQLLRNAVEASASGAPSPPEVSAAVGEGSVRLTVRDWGPGLPTANPRAVIRLAASAKAGGAGTGLLLAERIARLHGGSLAFGRPDKGTEASLTLPLA
jgi:signal transduction histidine kinase